MTAPAPLSRRRIASAYAVAALCDLAQLPVNLAYMTGALALPGEMLDFGLDATAFLATTALLGFHKALLPTAVLEAIPFADALPGWTMCVAYVVAKRKQLERT